jgi:hypothetical protein
LSYLLNQSLVDDLKPNCFSFFDSIAGDVVTRLMHTEIRGVPINRKSRRSAENHGIREVLVIGACEACPHCAAHFVCVLRVYRVCRAKPEFDCALRGEPTFHGLRPTAFTKIARRNTKT